MHQATLYQRANHVQRYDAERILKEYTNVIQWRLDGSDTLLDVGSGSGNVLMDFVHPLLPANFEGLIGTDISEQMVGFANKCYADYERTKFQVLDIGGDILPDEMCERYDHVTSFYCLHWVQNQKIALQNIYKLLRREGGDCLLVFLAANPVFDVYKSMSQTEKWSEYMKDVEQFISPLHYSEDPITEFGKLLYTAGFEDYNVEIRNEVYVYEGVQLLKENVMAVCPFLERIPMQRHAEFMDDFIGTVAQMKLREEGNNKSDYKFISPYKLVVAYARKCGSFFSSVIGEDQRTLKGLN